MIRSLFALCGSVAIAAMQAGPFNLPPIADGPFKPTWESLANYQTPEWFRDEKFSIWARWGPQCEPEDGDWYARNLYMQGSAQYQSHLANYGHPSTHGFKDVVHAWMAERFDPDALVKFYRKTARNTSWPWPTTTTTWTSTTPSISLGTPSSGRKKT